MKLCAFTLADGQSCTQPATKRSPAGLCRLHADVPQRSQNMLRARATQVLLPQRRRLRSEVEFLARKQRGFRIPDLDSLANLKTTLFIVMQRYESGVFDSRTTRGMLNCLRIGYINLRHQPAQCGTATERADFYAHYRAALDQLRRDRAQKGGLGTL